jgi:hypothetical protein
LLQSVGDERLRWLLRAGVVPRRSRTPSSPRRWRRRTGKPPAAEISTLWHRLARYAGGSVWVPVVLTIRRPSDTTRGCPALRQSLAEQPLPAQLHQAAAQWFEELSRRRPGMGTAGLRGRTTASRDTGLRRGGMAGGDSEGARDRAARLGFAAHGRTARQQGRRRTRRRSRQPAVAGPGRGVRERGQRWQSWP